MTGSDNGMPSGLPLRLARRVSDRPLTVWLTAGLMGSAIEWAFHLPCPFRRLTGLDCPVCGSSRAVLALCRANFRVAAHDNVLFVLMVVGTLAFAVSGRVRGWLRRCGRSADVGWWAVGIAVAWTVLRNLPSLSWLAPDRG